VWWDDLELLRLIDQLERDEVGSLFTGHALLQRAIRGKETDWTKEMAAFTRELVLARDAGYITCKEQNWPGQRMPDPALDPNMFLQRVGEIRLTIPGRDRARGRVIIQSPNDPNEDDGRPIARLILSDIADAISYQYSESQLGTFLTDSGIPDLVAQMPGSKDSLVSMFLALHDEGAAARRLLRTFIGCWLSDQLLTGPTPELKEKLLKQLDRQGWQVKDGRLVIGSRVQQPEGPAPTGPEQAQICLSGHPINFRVKSQPTVSKDFCPRCGQPTITNCPSCRKEISGDDFRVDAYCPHCGSPYPWTDKSRSTA